MKTPPRAVAIILSATLVPGCASTLTLKDVPVGGREVMVTSGEHGAKVKGELLYVEKDRLWLRTEQGVRELALREVSEVRVRRHGFGARKALIWTGAGAVASGVGMAGACASVEGSNGCAGWGLATAGIWLLVGALTAPAFESSSRTDYPGSSAEALRAFARLPQGLPPGVAPSTLAAPPAKPKKPPEPER